jgi:chaperonin GroEL (HSP60 family)
LQKLKPDEEELQRRAAEEEEAERQRVEEEFEVQGVVGAKKRGSVVWRHVAWLGGVQEWGKKAETWEKTVCDQQVLKIWERQNNLVGKKIRVRYSASGWARGTVVRFNARRHEIKYNDQEVETLDLLHGEKEWGLV